MVHIEHGIGRYLGLEPIPVGKSQHDCVALEYAGGDKLYVPVENLEVLSRYGSDSEGVSLDKLGGEAWQRRKARMKERIREIAGELLKTAAERALRPAEIAEPDAASRPAPEADSPITSAVRLVEWRSIPRRTRRPAAGSSMWCSTPTL